MNRPILKLLLNWLDTYSLTELLPLKPAFPVKGFGHKRVRIDKDELYNNDRHTYNAYIDSIKRIFFYELPPIHTYSNSTGYYVSPEADVILKLIISNNFDVDVDYKDVCEFANL